MPPDPSRVQGPLGLQQMYPPVTLKYPLVQKLIETPVNLIPAACNLILLVMVMF